MKTNLANEFAERIVEINKQFDPTVFDETEPHFQSAVEALQNHPEIVFEHLLSMLEELLL